MNQILKLVFLCCYDFCLTDCKNVLFTDESKEIKIKKIIKFTPTLRLKVRGLGGKLGYMVTDGFQIQTMGQLAQLSHR